MMRLVLLIWSATLLLSSAVIGNEEGEEYEFEFDVAKILEESKTSHYCEDHWGYKINWRNKDDGWDQGKRNAQVYLHIRNELQPRLIPALTETGYVKTKIPEKLHEFILDQMITTELLREDCPDSSHQNCWRLDDDGNRVDKRNVEVMRVKEPELVRSVLNKELGPILEKWSGIKLEPSMIYGVRRYLRGSWLALHVDRMDTHVVSAILQLDQNVDKDWPLYVLDMKGKRVKVVLEPGEMVLYESAKILHGRQEPLDGRFYDNIFVHFKPKKNWYASDFDVNNLPNKILTKKDLL